MPSIFDAADFVANSNFRPANSLEFIQFQNDTMVHAS